MTDEQNSRRVWLRAAFVLALIAAASAGLWYWRKSILNLSGNQEQIQTWITSFGPWAPLVSIGLNAAQVLLAPVPGQIIGLANGYLYGLWLGTLYSMIGLLVGTALAMVLARYLGRPLVERLVPLEALEKWDRITKRQGPFFFFLIFLIPGLPDDIVCLLIGLSPLPLRQMVVLALLGRLPGVLVSSWIGAFASEFPIWVWIPLGVGTAGLAWAFWRYREQVQRTLVEFAHRITAWHRSEEVPEADHVEEVRQAPP